MDLNDSLTNREPSIDFRDPEVDHDRVLLVENQKFYVQAEHLSRWSGYFKILFISEDSKVKREIEIKDVSAEEFHVFLKVICPGSFLIQEYHLKSLLQLSQLFGSLYVEKCCDMFILKSFDNLDKIELLKIASEVGKHDWKQKALDFLMENVLSFDKHELLQFACDFNLDELQKKLVGSFEINIQVFNTLQLVKYAFEQNSDELKKKVRYMIYTSDRIELFYRCNQCTDRMQRIGCPHIPAKSDPIQRNSFIAEFIDEICKLPKEMKDFVIRSTISTV